MSLSAHSQTRAASSVASLRPGRARALQVSAALKRQAPLKQPGDDAISTASKIGLGLTTSAAMLFSVFTGPCLAQEIASIAAESPLEDAAEAARTLVPSPDGLLNPEKAAQNAEAQEKRAVKAPESSFRAASPVGGEGEVSNLADQGLKGGQGFKDAAAKLNSANSEQQYANATEFDKQLQKQDDYKRAAQFKENSPGSGTGNSVIGRSDKQISGGGEKPQPPSFSIFGLGGK